MGCDNSTPQLARLTTIEQVPVWTKLAKSANGANLRGKTITPQATKTN
jgi:hypothetical protein